MSISKIDEIEEQKKRQGFFSIGLNSPASYFAAAVEREQINGIDDVETVGAATEPNNQTTYKNSENTRQAVETKEQQDQMPNRDEGVQKALMAQELLAMYNKLRLDLT